jgi:hypothetical protein
MPVVPYQTSGPAPEVFYCSAATARLSRGSGATRQHLAEPPADVEFFVPSAILHVPGLKILPVRNIPSAKIKYL